LGPARSRGPARFPAGGAVKKSLNSRIVPIIRKEILHILRDKRTLAIMLVIPLVEMLLFGYAVTTDIKHLPLAVLDQDRSAQSRDLVDAYRVSSVFDINAFVSSEDELALLIDSGEARAGLIIGPGFSDDLLKRGSAQVAFIIDGSDPTVASTSLSTAVTVGQARSVDVVRSYLARRGAPLSGTPGLEVRTRVWYNPDMVSANFMVPALIGFILQILTTMLTALSIVREKELGTVEQLIVTPIQPLELVVGKIVPYALIAIFDAVEILVLGSWWFNVPINGSVSLLIGLSCVFLLSSLGIGVLISSVARTQQEAMFLSFFSMFPAIFLSGFMFPLASMPEVLQALSYAVPLRYFLVIVRGIVLKGNGMDILWPQALALAIFGVAIVGLAASRFRKRLG
jgi:ABC-2 type transport system permease protein